MRKKIPRGNAGLFLTKGSIRPVWEKDLFQLKQIMKEGLVFSRDDTKGIYSMVRDYLGKCEKDELRTYVYSIGGIIGGFISFGKELGEDTWELYAISVSPKYQGKGIGLKLIKKAEKMIKIRKGRIICISTSSAEDYLPARKLYKKAGYVKCAKINDFFADGDHKMILIKRLKKKKGF